MKSKFLLASLIALSIGQPVSARTAWVPITDASQVTTGNKYVIAGYNPNWSTGPYRVLYFDSTTNTAVSKTATTLSPETLTASDLTSSAAEFTFTEVPDSTCSGHSAYTIFNCNVDGHYVVFYTTSGAATSQSTNTDASSTQNLFHINPTTLPTSVVNAPGTYFNLHYNLTSAGNCQKFMAMSNGNTFGYASVTSGTRSDNGSASDWWTYQYCICKATEMSDEDIQAARQAKFDGWIADAKAEVTAMFSVVNGITIDSSSLQGYLDQIDALTLSTGYDLTLHAEYVQIRTTLANIKSTLSPTISSAVLSQLDGKYVSLYDAQVNRYAGVAIDASVVSATDTEVSARNVWQFIKKTDSENGETAFTIYNPLNECYLGTLASFNTNTAVPTSSEGVEYKLIYDATSNKWSIQTTAFTTTTNCLHVNTGVANSNVIYWNSVTTSEASGWTFSVIDDETRKTLAEPIISSFDTEKENVRTTIDALPLIAASEYDAEIAALSVNEFASNYMTNRKALLSIAEKAANDMATRMVDHTFLIKNNRSALYLTANITDAATTLLGKAAYSANSLWTMKKSEGTATNSFKLYNAATGYYFTSGASTTQPALLSDEANATEFLIEAYAPTSSYKGSIALKSTTITSSTTNVYLHFTVNNENSMYYTLNDAGTPFTLVTLDQAIATDKAALEAYNFESTTDATPAAGQYSETAYQTFTTALNSDAANSTDAATVKGLYDSFDAWRSSFSFPVFRIEGPDDFYSLTAATGTTAAYALSDPLDKAQYWTVKTSDETLGAGTYTIANYSTGAGLAGNTTLTINADGCVNGLSIGNNAYWTPVFVGSTAELDAQSETLNAYTAGTLPTARFISRHIGSRPGEYSAPEGSTDNLSEIAENFQSYTASAAAYAGHADEVTTLAAKLNACTLNVPATGQYLRLKASPKYAISSLSGVQTYYSSTLSGGTATSAANAEGDNETSTLFYYSPSTVEGGNAHLISYQGGFSKPTSNGMLSFCTSAAENTSALATASNVNTGFEISQGEVGTYVFRFRFSGTSLSSGRCPCPVAAGSAVNGGEGTLSAFSTLSWPDCIVEPVESLPFTLHSDGKLTVQVPVALQIPDAEGYKFFATKLDGTEMRLHQVEAGEKFAANTAIIVEGDASSTVRFAIVDANDPDICSDFQGTKANTYLTAFADVDNQVSFVNLTPSTTAAAAPAMRRAASTTDGTSSITLTKLTAGSEVPVNAMIVNFSGTTAAANQDELTITLPQGTDPDEDDVLYDAAEHSLTVTSISEVQEAEAAEAVSRYDLMGRRIATSGAAKLFIENGKLKVNK